MKKIILIFAILLICTISLAAEQAQRVTTSTTNFNSNLSAADTTVQKALDTLDDMVSGGGSGDSVTVNSTAATDANFLDNIYTKFSLNTVPTPDDITAKPDYSQTLIGNPALLTTECIFMADGILCEGTTADAIEIKLAFPDPVTTDKTITLPNATDTLVGKDTTDTLTNKTLAAANNVIDADTAVALAANGANCTAGNYPLGVDALGAVETCTADDDIPEAGDYTNLTGGAGIVNSPIGTIATASSEADFLTSGALTCGASTQGKAQVHTTPLQYCDNAATPVLQYAAYGSSTGVATSATALATNGGNCNAGSYPLGVDASGAVESCTVAGSGLPAVDTTSVVQGSVDGTKELRFEVDGFTTATIRVLTPPDFDGTIATLAGIETLTNKTLAAADNVIDADTVITNANLTGPITSVGNATFVAAQTGTGTTFVMQETPTLTTPVIGVATGTSLSLSGALTGVGGTHTAITGLGVRSTGTGAFDMKIANAENLTVADKTLTVQLGDADRTLILGASPSVSGTNTGDQTITLTGGVTGSGVGSFAATVITNANLTGEITSVGNAAVLGSFTSASLLGALTNETGTGVAVFGTSPRFTTSINDSGGNELFKLTATGSAVNEFTVTNAAASGNPTLSVTGDSDANINIGLTAKGTGGVVITSTGAGPSAITHGITVNNDGVSTGAGDDFIVKGDTMDDLLHVDASADKIGINVAAPANLVDILGVVDTTIVRIKNNESQALTTAADIYISFDSTTGVEGTIAGTAVAGVIGYNTFLSSHFTEIVGEIPSKIGMVLEMAGDVLKEESPHLSKSKLCRTKYSKKIYGVYGGPMTEEQSKNVAKGSDKIKYYVFGGGAGVILVSNENGNIKTGDLLVSDGNGYAMKQKDDIIRSSTIGKAVVDVDWSKEKEKTKIIGCIIYSG